MYVDDLFKTARKKWLNLEKMTLYLLIDHTETAVQIACDMCVTQHKGTTKPNFFTYKIKYHVYNQYCPLKNI